jgi:hypothetical protein
MEISLLLPGADNLGDAAEYLTGAFALSKHAVVNRITPQEGFPST